MVRFLIILDQKVVLPIRRGSRYINFSFKGNETAEWNNFFSIVAESKGIDTFTGIVFIPASGEKPKFELKEVGGNQILT